MVKGRIQNDGSGDYYFVPLESQDSFDSALANYEELPPECEYIGGFPSDVVVCLVLEDTHRG